MKKPAFIKLPAIISILFLLLISGCAEKTEETAAQQAEQQDKIINENTVWTEEDLCITLCRAYQGDKSDGPCLGFATYNWVCDIAHNPRQEIDNLGENQCADYREGGAEHFVEVDPECNFIRKK